MSFTATINLAKHTWDMTPSEAFDWYIAHLEKSQRYQTIETANTYRDALEDDFVIWIGRNASRGVIKAKTPRPDEEAAIIFLLERGYTVSKVA